MDKKKRTLPPLSDTGRFSRIVARSGRWFLTRHFLPFCLSAACVFIPVSSVTYAANPGESGSHDGISRRPVVLDLVPEKSKFECVACVIWFMCIGVRMSATAGEFLMIPPDATGNSRGFIRIDTNTLETISERIAERIKKTYLETDEYPEISFSLKELKGDQAGILLAKNNRFTASGTLELHGVKREIVFRPEVFLNNDVIEFQGEVVVRLTEFNIKIPRFMFLNVKDEISIRFKVAWDYSPHLKKGTAGVVP